MTSAWDVTLPQRLLINGASQGIGDGLLEVQPDTGPSITRLRSTAVMAPLSGNMIVSSAQLATFKAFFITTLLRGSLPFTFPDPVTGATLLVKFTKAAPPSWSPLGADNFQLNLALMVLP
jgi:hypothetical protein